MDGRTLSLPVDSASTAGEICQALAKKVQLSDTFGFSLYVSMYEKVTTSPDDFFTVSFVRQKSRPSRVPGCFFVFNRGSFSLNLPPRLLPAGLGSGQRPGAPDGRHLPVRAGCEEAGQAGAARPLEALLPQGDLHPVARLRGGPEEHRPHLQADRPGPEAGRVPLRQGGRAEEPAVGDRPLEGRRPLFTRRRLFFNLADRRTLTSSWPPNTCMSSMAPGAARRW